MYGSLLHLLRTKKIQLLNVPTIVSQLTQLQKKLNPMGQISIAAPAGKHDDVASVIAMGAMFALQNMPFIKPLMKAQTLFEQGVDSIMRKRQQAEEVWQ
jgi:hypothetical protein